MTNSKRAAIVLAAGKGKRMKSDLPKVLHEINGRPMIQMVLDTLVKCNLEKIIVVIGFKGELVEQSLADYRVDFVWQREQLGTQQLCVFGVLLVSHRSASHRRQGPGGRPSTGDARDHGGEEGKARHQEPRDRARHRR